MTLAGKAAVVSGGSTGLGREIALEYARQGAQVAISSNIPELDEAVAAACREDGGTAVAIPADVRSEADVRNLVERCIIEFGALDIFVAAAGLDIRETQSREDRYVERLLPDQWRTVIETNLTGTFLCVRAAARPMIEAGSGSIVTFSSGTVRFPRPGLSAYVSSKFAIEGLTQVVAQEVARHGVRVNAIQPGGLTDTGFFPAWTSEEERAAMHRPSVIRGLAVYVASDESLGVTGQSLVATDWNRERGLALCPCPACTTAAPPAAFRRDL